jgi:glycosyltransferase involved in cell wall biosynthesis
MARFIDLKEEIDSKQESTACIGLSMTTILFYSPFNQRSRDTESLMVGFRKKGHRVLSLSQAQGELIHPYLETQGVETYTYVVPGRQGGIWFYGKHILYLIRFCKRHRVDVMYSHLESANFVAVMAHWFINARVYIVRHHVDEAAFLGFDKSVYYRLTYSMAPHTLVVSEHARQYMINQEGHSPDRITHINLAYDFDLYPKPDPVVVKTLRQTLSGPNERTTILISVGRLIPTKRIELSLQVVSALVLRGIPISLIILGSGPELESVRQLTATKGLSDHVFFYGYVPNVTDYLAASDFLLHPSKSESSCVVVKEAAITRLPVIVCKGVGDFDDYIVDKKNGFLVSQDNFVEGAVAALDWGRQNPQDLKSMTEKLYRDVVDFFGLSTVIGRYEKFNQGE